MKKILIAFVLVVVIGGFAYWSSTNSGASTTLVTTTTDTTNTTSAGSETTNPAAVGTNDTTGTGSTGSTGTTAATGTYKDGTYTGSVADAFYGKLQVAAVILGGKITDVKFIQYPNDQHESQQVNGRSNPILKSEAIAAQSAKVNIVSGATQSSEAFQQSLGVALAAAHA